TSRKEAEQQSELRWLTLKLADRLCQAPDYADQATGIDRKSSALGDLLALKPPLAPEPQALLRIQQEEHTHAFASYPRTRSMLLLNVNGLDLFDFPQLGLQPKNARGGPVVFMESWGGFGWSEPPTKKE